MTSDVTLQNRASDKTWPRNDEVMLASVRMSQSAGGSQGGRTRCMVTQVRRGTSRAAAFPATAVQEPQQLGRRDSGGFPRYVSKEH